jgi:hypothetical protein
MRKKVTEADLLIRALLKLDRDSGERRNVIMFVQSCYACRVLTYDFDRAQKSLGKLTDREQHALIAYIMRIA